jgi:hypothetical protein
MNAARDSALEFECALTTRQVGNVLGVAEITQRPLGHEP